ncbi:MAG: glucose 1-dehydrogenase [Armatimonadota bacterium]|nr:glucose 1-dehydrogenase [Armatimonadota bacterium]
MAREHAPDARRRLQDRVAIVTGAASGIGRAIAVRFAGEGARVVIADRDRDSAEAVAAEIGGHAVPTDVTRAGEVGQLFAGVLASHGRLDVLVNSAGIGKLGGLLEATDEAWHETLAVNLTGVFLCARAAARAMSPARAGKIINIASVVGVIGFPGRVAYCASKAGVLGLTKAMALDCAAFNVQVNAICPGPVLTPMTSARFSDPETLAEKLLEIPLRRLGQPDDIASAAAFLASADADWITGHALVVDGGMSVD